MVKVICQGRRRWKVKGRRERAEGKRQNIDIPPTQNKAEGRIFALVYPKHWYAKTKFHTTGCINVYA